MSKVSHNGSVLYLDSEDSTWVSDIGLFTRANARRMRGDGSRLYALSSKLDSRQSQVDFGKERHSMHREKLSLMLYIMGSTLKQEEQAAKRVSELEIASSLFDSRFVFASAA